MPSIYQLKPRFQALLRPLVQRLHDSGITANQVTLAALVVSLAGDYEHIVAPSGALSKSVLPRVAAMLDGLCLPAFFAHSSASALASPLPTFSSARPIRTAVSALMPLAVGFVLCGLVAAVWRSWLRFGLAGSSLSARSHSMHKVPPAPFATARNVDFPGTRDAH